MSEIATAVSTLNAHGQQSISIAAIKQVAESEKQIVAMLDELIDSAPTLQHFFLRLTR